MRKLHIVVIFISLLAMLSAGACGAQSNGSTKDGSERSQPKPLTGSAKDFDRAQFDDPAHIDKWLPLRPGTQLVYEGSAIPDEGESPIPSRCDHRHRPD